MLKYVCRNDNIKTKSSTCPVCGERTELEKSDIYWCDNCKVPLFQSECECCSGKGTRITTDIRPVFPEERLLLEILLDKIPGTYEKDSVWNCSGNKYLINGKRIKFSVKELKNKDVDDIRSKYEEASKNISYEYFEQYADKFVQANRSRYEFIVREAVDYIKNSTKDYTAKDMFVSFSGGKDSTVTSDIVMRALSEPKILHIFGDTTLEFPFTQDYVSRYRKAHMMSIFKIAKNREQDFYNVCSDIGPPARMMRWCCSMFKTGPITRIINNLYRNQQILTFYGVRKSESVSRSKYNRVENNAESVKIQQQTVASPIFFWKDIDIWLYIFSEKIDFNDAYRLGYDRVGCWCCPNNTQRAQFLSKIYMPEQSKKWRAFLIDFARKIGKPDPEVYVDTGKWKARQGGNGLVSANDVKIKFTNCTTEDNAKIYKLVKPFDDELIGMFTPLGKISRDLGQKILNEILILDVKTNVPIISIQPFGEEKYEYAVKIKTMNVADHEKLQRMIQYQVRKFNACRKCLKCESLCKAGAISIIAGTYNIDSNKCIRCKMCVTAKYLEGGCMMDKYLRTK